MTHSQFGVEQKSIAASRADKLLGFAIGLTAYTFLSLGGRISIAEIICVVALALTFARSAYFPAQIGKIALPVVVIIAGLVTSGAVHAVQASETLGAAVNYAFVFLLICVVAGLLFRSRDYRILTPLVFGAAIGQVAGLVLSPTASALIDPWKFGLGSAVNLSVLMALTLAVRRGMPKPAALTLVTALALLNIALGSRSAAALVALSGVLVLIRPGLSKRKYFGVFVAVVALVGLLLATLAYESLAGSGALGDAAGQKLLDQSGDYGLLFGARKELVVLFVSWTASPIFGWGASATVDPGVRDAALSWFINNGYALSPSDFDRLFATASVPLHSVALGALVQAGIFAIPIIVVLFGMLAGAIRGGIAIGSFAMMFVALSGATHFLTSPLGDTTRFPLAIAVAFGVVWLTDRRSTPDIHAARNVPGDR
jgi:hypothetical protein